jgi:hypothetical protein
VNEIQSTLLALLPQGRKITTGGWESFNAVCCHHRGEKADRRRRGGIKIDGEAWTYHCFNCSYKAGWSPGKLLSGNTKMLFKWLGLGDNDIGKLGIVALKYQESMPQESKAFNFTLKEIPLPDNSLSIVDWLNTGSDDPDLIAVVEYLLSRGMEWEWYNWHWSSAPGYRDRLLIPFYQDGKIVGYTGRKVTEGKPKYLTDSQSGYVFNLDRQTRDRAYVIVVEGQFDAIAVDGVAIMTNEPNDTQVARINALGREVICVPDRDRPGSKMLKHAIKNEWSVSLPPWGDDLKDVADAVKKYGRLYVLATILHYRVSGEIKINLIKKKLENLDE